MPEHQGPRRHAVCDIRVSGQPVTTRLHPYLISVQVIDTIEGTACECNIELDDRNAELQIPPNEKTLQVSMGWAGEGPRLFDQSRVVAPLTGQEPTLLVDYEARELPWGGPG